MSGIQLENIFDFVVDGVHYKLGSFKNVKLLCEFLEENQYNLSYIRYRAHDDANEHYEYYLKEGLKHRLDGPAHLKYEVETNGFGQGEKILLSTKYYINDKEIKKEDFNKHSEVRNAKLKRILE